MCVYVYAIIHTYIYVCVYTYSVRLDYTRNICCPKPRMPPLLSEDFCAENFARELRASAALAMSFEAYGAYWVYWV